ncbi:TPA: glycosyltransferase family 2 protein [Candidatus Woesearchaeota archaeon]|nr:hypothetical protein [uncultured archaeon]MBS3172841.1 glycosyltransferase family 2 protein [Candidatus Woesearchaeota archaeon]HIH32381.1 glycosyltransferase family 2 protein [Candidatus Woesearchaeota archaeon]HIH54520.1 glycosyltransferase family 2 protein [Candidatus Woesearchaeota archaeon]HIJ02258.1 glycosyltransferase family 2 protein [Candidatus Woesearchaeota archaeon]
MTKMGKSIKTSNRIKISIIIPAYNEESRMKSFLEEIMSFCKSKLKNYELIFVDDGSKDDTKKIFERFKSRNSNIQLISYSPNHGKGYAVKKGIFAARGEYVLFIDIDGSIQPKEIPKMLQMLKKYPVVVGSRALASSNVKQSLLRKMTSSLFNPYVNFLFHNKVNDHLCGFKGFHKEIAKQLFKDLINERWLFDVELFYKIRKRKIRFYEQPIDWIHKEDSKMKFIDPLKMLYELIYIRIQLASRLRKYK